MSETMGQIIRRLRKERNLTQEELAEQLNVTSQAISRWEQGTGMPDISQVVPLANVFGVPTDVLFGVNFNDADKEIENFIVQMETLVCNRPENVSGLDHYLDWCNRVQEKLKTYPNYYRLLEYSIGCIRIVLHAYLCEEEEGKEKDFSPEKSMWESELFRQANIVLNHCTDASLLDNVNRNLFYFYEGKNDFEKAEEYTKRLPKFDWHTDKGKFLAFIYQQTNRLEEAKKLYGEGIYHMMDGLEHQLTMIGNMFAREGKHEEAYACYRLYPDIYDLIVGEKDEIPYCLNPAHDLCALECMRLERPDEAMDWLEKMVKHQRYVAKNYNVITETKLPYFYGTELHYWKNSYPVEEQITPILAGEQFDSIRETDRFKAILADAEAFEKGE